MGLEVEDLPTENIIKVMYEGPWKWTMDCWEVTGTKVNTKPKVVTPSKKAKEMVSFGDAGSSSGSWTNSDQIIAAKRCGIGLGKIMAARVPLHLHRIH
ncbi:hypothetical protein Bca52824_051864 [Brassica carinata]|uniref:Uncharacterized protein n=1 Tax=Brassica carinata TaxID=52824 RepID=A0A8X7R8S3_BRACI|nr:hypothetical protein Bca52824_051864 [Brassica carinata]